MREQLRKEIVKRTGSLVQSAEAAAAYEEESGKITEHYDRLIREGKTELEAYRAMLADIEVMKAVLAAIPPSEDAASRDEVKKKNRAWHKKLGKLAGSANAILWLITVPFYFLISFATDAWHLTWLTFLTSAMGSILIDMVMKYNKGIQWSKMGGWHGLMWIGITVLYFLTGFLSSTGWVWAVNWLLFIGGALAEVIWGMLRRQ